VSDGKAVNKGKAGKRDRQYWKTDLTLSKDWTSLCHHYRWYNKHITLPSLAWQPCNR